MLQENRQRDRWRGLWIDHRKPYRAGWNELGIVIHAVLGLPSALTGLLCLLVAAAVGLDSPSSDDARGGVALAGLFLLTLGGWCLALMVQLIRRQLRHKRETQSKRAT